MPGVAEQDIALDLARGTARRSSGPSPTRNERNPKGSLIGRAFLFLAIDFLITFGVGVASYYAITAQPGSPHAVMLVLGLVSTSVTVSFWERGLYNTPNLFSRELRLHRLLLAWLQATGFALLLVLCAVSLMGANPAWPALAGIGPALRGAWLPVFLVAGLGGLAAARILRCRILAASVPPNRTVIVGTTEVCRDLLFRLRRRSGHPLNLLGVVEHGYEAALPPDAFTARRTFCDLPVLGGMETLIQMIRGDEIDTVLVALPWSEAAHTRAVVSRIAVAPVDVYIVPGLEGFTFPNRQVPILAELPLVMACNRPLTGWQAFVKRAEDVILGGLLLILVAPAMLGIAALIRVSSRGPVFFRQRRLGFNNRIIEVLKFRTMYADLTDADARQQTMRGDKRVTPLGSWLRRTSLDELPQLLNVLKGDMSLVGPRPHALQTTAGGLPLEDAVPEYSSRHRVKPGITGWAQINGYRGALDSVDKIVHRVNHDLFYIENWSLALDLKILWRTARLILVDDNAF